MSHPFEAYIKNVPNFPKPGVMFKDITPLMQDHFDAVVEAMGEGVSWDEIDVIVGIESRGFILGAAMAIKFKKGFIPVRKKGKLPPPVVSESYALEYGTDTIEMGPNSRPLKALVVDDVLATGGTLKAACKLCMANNIHVQAMAVLINLTFLNNLKEEGHKLHSVLNY